MTGFSPNSSVPERLAALKALRDVTTPDCFTQILATYSKRSSRQALWYGGRIDKTVALSDDAVRASFQGLGMLYQLTIPVPPGPPEEM